MEFPKKQLLVVGDRVLITPEEGEDRSRVGLYLPASALEAQQVQSGLIVATGPGEPMPDFSALDDEPWKASRRDTGPASADAGPGRRPRDLLPQGGGRDHLRGTEVPGRAPGRHPRAGARGSAPLAGRADDPASGTAASWCSWRPWPLLALAVAIAAFRDLVPRPLGFLGLGLFLVCLAMIAAIGWETRRDMLATARGSGPGPDDRHAGRQAPRRGRRHARERWRGAAAPQARPPTLILQEGRTPARARPAA